MKTPRQCAILVGGFGSRLGALTLDTPKPLLDCGGRPFLGWIIRELSRFGIEEIVLLTGYKAQSFEKFADEIQVWLPKKMSIRFSSEPVAAGTGGAVWHARGLLDDSFLLVNGDSWIDANISSLFASSNSNAIGQLALRKEPQPSRFGVVELDGDVITGIQKKKSIEGPALINAGIYLFTRDLLTFLSPSCSIENDVFPTLAAKRLIDGHVLNGYFIDIGIPSDYERAKTELPLRLKRPAVFFDRDGVLNYDRGWVGFKKDFHWMETAKEAVRAVNDAGFHAFIVTNQPGVARGLYGESDVHALHAWVIDELHKSGATIDDVNYCPHHVDATVPHYRKACRMRKPEPGMINDLCARWQVDKRRSFLVGDKLSDIEASSRAGISGSLVGDRDLYSLVRETIDQQSRFSE
jgi:D,D-heptose 1,7-bisphosphate phosphatase